MLIKCNILIDTRSTYFTKEKRRLGKTRPRAVSSHADRDVKHSVKSAKATQGSEPKNERFICPQRKRSVIIQGNDFNADSKYQHSKQDNSQIKVNHNSSKEFVVKEGQLHPLRKCSSWPVISFTGLHESNHRQNRCANMFILTLHIIRYNLLKIIYHFIYAITIHF